MKVFELLTVTQVWASAAEAETHAPAISELFFPLINFLIYAFLIKRFVVPAVRDYLRSRRQEVVTLIEGATENKQRAEAIVQDYRERLARLDQEIQSIHSSLRAEGEREKTKLLQEAERLAAKIREDAAFLADQEVKLARQKIREEMADQAEATAKELIQRHLSPADQSRLVADFIQNVGAMR